MMDAKTAIITMVELVFFIIYILTKSGRLFLGMYLVLT